MVPHPGGGGRLSAQVRLFADERNRRHVTGLLHQVLLTNLAATAGTMAVLLGTGGGPRGDHRGEPAPAVRLQPPGDLLDPRAAGLVLIFRPDR